LQFYLEIKFQAGRFFSLKVKISSPNIDADDECNNKKGTVFKA
jgi:hypothetical protein